MSSSVIIARSDFVVHFSEKDDKTCACGISAMYAHRSGDWKRVTCKNCRRSLNRFLRMTYGKESK